MYRINVLHVEINYNIKYQIHLHIHERCLFYLLCLHPILKLYPDNPKAKKNCVDKESTSIESQVSNDTQACLS